MACAGGVAALQIWGWKVLGVGGCCAVDASEVSNSYQVPGGLMAACPQGNMPHGPA